MFTNLALEAVARALPASDRISAFTGARGYTLYYAQSLLAGAAADQAEGRSLSAPVAPFSSAFGLHDMHVPQPLPPVG